MLWKVVEPPFEQKDMKCDETQILGVGIHPPQLVEMPMEERISQPRSPTVPQIRLLTAFSRKESTFSWVDRALWRPISLLETGDDEAAPDVVVRHLRS